MKSFIVLFALIVISTALTDEQKEKIKTIGKQCKASSEVEREKLEKLRNGEIENDPKLKAFLRCTFEKLEFQKPDGTIDKEKVKSRLPSKLSETEKEEIVNECTNVTETDVTEIAYSVYKCYRSKTTAHNADLFL
uniref:Odorant binding protein 22 n=1 Tax=Holotrichia oblita TaxID=644536 RepID=A0A3Q8U172_HOLOL|nr:odorant binding protein 22 [Holotrichia oblita]